MHTSQPLVFHAECFGHDCPLVVLLLRARCTRATMRSGRSYPTPGYPRGVAQAAPEQKKATEVATTQIAEAEIVQAEEGQAVSIGQEVEDTNLA